MKGQNFNVRLMNRDGEKFAQEVYGYILPNIFGKSFFIYKKNDDFNWDIPNRWQNEWVVTEYESGMRVCSNHRRKHAIDELEKIANKCGEEGFIKTIDDAIVQNGKVN